VKQPSNKTNTLIQASRLLGVATNALKFAAPVHLVYNPLDYAWSCHEEYLRRFGGGKKRVVFLGMNPGPFGMVQTGIPFGQIAAVRDWLKIEQQVGRPACEHPRRPITGFDCKRSEVSGERLWGLFAERFGRAEAFFAEHMVMNYCPLAFLEKSGRNRTPDKLALAEKEALFQVCDEHLRASVAVLHPEWLIGIGDFAFQRAKAVFENSELKLGRVLHPSPANPAANRGWSAAAIRQLEQLGVWSPGFSRQNAASH
jgi:single-strand selective monofunctional uracil DNA glycosylase